LARFGLVVIGGEGATVLGGLAAASVGFTFGRFLGGLVPLPMAGAVMCVGGAWIGALSGRLKIFQLELWRTRA